MKWDTDSEVSREGNELLLIGDRGDSVIGHDRWPRLSLIRLLVFVVQRDHVETVFDYLSTWNSVEHFCEARNESTVIITVIREGKTKWNKYDHVPLCWSDKGVTGHWRDAINRMRVYQWLYNNKHAYTAVSTDDKQLYGTIQHCYVLAIVEQLFRKQKHRTELLTASIKRRQVQFVDWLGILLLCVEGHLNYFSLVTTLFNYPFKILVSFRRCSLFSRMTVY